ncbi:hypothetical protein F0562_027234 [Nyssa sinensis]|uniref:Uncharacterized protein n=1 Tax=Nyssa sinensis TaxID=561372 RepID=A0A5J5B5T0_9ASTE|nr:hypothetical protein F0562_027234 [Nyssa sinensis]
MSAATTSPTCKSTSATKTTLVPVSDSICPPSIPLSLSVPTCLFKLKMRIPKRPEFSALVSIQELPINLRAKEKEFIQEEIINCMPVIQWMGLV